MNYDMILRTLDSSLISVAVNAALDGESVACVINSKTPYSEEEYTLALDYVLKEISPHQHFRKVVSERIPEGKKKQLLWRHICNKVHVRLISQRAEFIEYLELMGVEVLHGGMINNNHHTYRINKGHLRYIVTGSEILETNKTSHCELVLPGYVEQSFGFSDLMNRKMIPEKIVVNQTESRIEQSTGIFLLQELAYMLNLEIFDLDLHDGEMKFGITLDGKVRIKNGILKNVTFDLLWHPSDVEALKVEMEEDNEMNSIFSFSEYAM